MRFTGYGAAMLGVCLLVTGNAYEPKIEIKPLPVIGNTLELLGTKNHPAGKK